MQTSTVTHLQMLKEPFVVGGGGNLNKLVSAKQTDVLRRYEWNMTVLEEYKTEAHVSFYTAANIVLFKCTTMISITGWYME